MQRFSRSPIESPPDRGGSTLLIVIVLLGMLSLVGFLFYTFAASERSAATYFADANKYFTPDFDADTLVEFGLEQLIIGPEGSLHQSALYGGRHSMIPNMFGRDIYAYNGAGIHLGSNNGLPFVDMNRNNVSDDDTPVNDNTDGDTMTDETPLNAELLQFNDSGSAQGWTVVGGQTVPNRDLTNWPDPGVDYTYPDINNLFLAYKGPAIDVNGNPIVDSSGKQITVIIPSFHRPQLLRGAGGAPIPAGGALGTNWYDYNDTTDPLGLGYRVGRRVLRPHPNHLNPNGLPRFPQAGLPSGSTFPFQPPTTSTAIPPTPGGWQGVWSLPGAYTVGNPADMDMYFDVDNDRDGIKEGIWLDLNHPVQTTVTGQKYIPLYSFTIYDADGLFNLNVHGNHAHASQLTTLADLTSNLPVNLSGAPRHLSGSNQGLTPFEVNPQPALFMDPSTAPVGAIDTSYNYQFGAAPTTTMQAANMDWWRLMAGSANFQSATTFNDLYSGRYGEANTWLYGAFMQGITNSSAISAAPANQMPAPGETGVDDNWNAYEGQFAWNVRSSTPGFGLSTNLETYAPNTPQFYPRTLQYYTNYPNGNPLDYNADGTISRPGFLGKQRYFTQNPDATYNSMKYQQFVNYDNPGVTGVPTNLDPNTLDSVAAYWLDADPLTPGRQGLGGLQMRDRTQMALPQNPDVTQPTSPQLDEAQEFLAEPSVAGTLGKRDAMFRDDEMSSLHLPKAVRDTLSLSSRARNLAPFNLNNPDSTLEARSDAIAGRFTTSSFDRRQFGIAGLASDTAYKFGLPLPDTSRAEGIDNNRGDSVVNRPWEMSDLNGDFRRETFPPVLYHLDTANPAQSGYLNSTNGNLSTGVRQFDPLRGPVRKLLQSTYENRTPNGDKQLRLSINHLTTTDSNPRNDFAGNVIQRGLTPHDPTLTATPVVSGSQEFHARLDRQQMARDIYVMLYLLGGGLDFATQNGHTGPIAQFNPATDHPNIGYFGSNAPDTSAQQLRNLYSDRQLREMAQFAVNVVDALDPDHVMTKFEYDKNLGNGWGIFDGDLGTSILLDDNPYTNEFTAYTSGSLKFDPNYPEDSDERGVVYGVETQEMTFSEVLAFQCPRMHMPAGTPFDHTATEHNETEVRYHTYLELRNISPKMIDFGATNCWRIRSVSRNMTLQAYGPQRYVKFTQGEVAPSSIFTIGNAGEMDAALVGPDHSRFRAANTNSAGTAVDASDPQCWIAPKTVNALDLDLVANRDNTGTYRFQLIDPGATFTDLYNVADDTDITNSMAGTDGVGRFFNDTSLHDPTYVSDTSAQQDAKDNSIQQPMFILERRQYPDRPAPAFNVQAENNDNPWVPVDQVTVAPFRRFGLLPTDSMQSQFDTVLRQLLSRERAQPLSNAEQDYKLLAASPTPPTPPNDVKANSLMLENSWTDITTPFSDWQMPYDRPFASPGELLQIPLYGPQDKTKWLLNSTQSPKAQCDAAELAASTMIAPIAFAAGQQIGIPTAFSAAGKILMPQHVNNIYAPPTTPPSLPPPIGYKKPVDDNRWYRFFEFFEVPTRMHRQIGNPLDQVRVPGRISLNGMRYTDVLAGLLDDREVMSFNPSLTTNRPTLYAQDGGDVDAAMPANLRDWWVQFLKSRDGRRTTATGDNDANGNPIVRMSPDNVTGLFLPGLADSSPFRSFASLGFTRIAGTFDAPETALDQTLFRRLPIDMTNQISGGNPESDPTFDTRHLWEVGKAVDHTGQPGADVIDAGMRDRLLTKIFNNSTTRSHVFYVFVSVQFFEADDTTFTAADPRNVQIGGPLQADPEYRGFFVIDRSKPEDAYDGVSGRFTNYRSMIKYRLRIE